MKHGAVSTIDPARRLVLPREIRGRIEIEPAPREVRIVRKDRIRVAVSVEEGDVLRGDTVRETTALSASVDDCCRQQLWLSPGC